MRADPAPSPEASAGEWHARWGPERELFTTEHPAGYAVLNSITDNPAVGDERNFVRVRQKGEGDYGDYVRAGPGDVLELTVYIGNDASDGIDGSAATIHGLAAEFYFPESSSDMGVLVTLRGKNARDVWDGVTILADEPIELNPISGSMTMRTNAGEMAVDMGDHLGTVTLGWDKLDGEYPVGYSADGKYLGNGYLNVELAVNKPD